MLKNKRIRKRHSAEVKAQVALAAIRDHETTAQIAARYGVHPAQVSAWEKQAKELMPEVFSSEHPRQEQDQRELVDELYKQIGQLTIQLDWLKKSVNRPLSQLRELVEPEHEQLSVRLQCRLLGLSRSSLYYPAQPVDPEDLVLMRLLDQQYLKTPFYGVRRMTQWLREEQWTINIKRVRRLLRLMGLEAIYPRPHLSQPSSEHRKYPYLLQDLTINRPGQVWSTDITFIPMNEGWLYLTAVLDWFSRYVLSWRLSNTLDSLFCVEALEEALARYHDPEIFNSDQGAQFTASEFTGVLKSAGIAISMDGRGRALDNVFIERLWRTVKYEEVYLKGYQDGQEAHRGLSGYFPFYNCERGHQSMNYLTPESVYFGRCRYDRDELALRR